jgi:regulation of enolase protein 1 (concanavalin A-like superfamily)
VAGALCGIEGPNEPESGYDWSPRCCGDPDVNDGIPKEVRYYQKKLYETARAVRELDNIPVIGPSLLKQGDSEMGDLSAWCDFGSDHPYPNLGEGASDVIRKKALLYPVNWGNKKLWATETGADFSFYGDEHMACSIMRLFTAPIADGFEKVFMYNLYSKEGSSPHDQYGLIKPDGTRRDAYYVLQRIISILKEPGTNFNPGTLNYSVLGENPTDVGRSKPQRVGHYLTQKSDGTFYLMAWADTDIWHDKNKTRLDEWLPFNLRVNANVAKIERYNPYAGTTVEQTWSNTNKVDTWVPPSGYIFKITLNGSGGYPTANIKRPSNGLSYQTDTTLNFQIDAADTDGGTIKSVGIYEGDTLIAAKTTAPWTVKWNNVPAGRRAIHARVTDNSDKISFSSPIFMSDKVTYAQERGCVAYYTFDNTEKDSSGYRHDVAYYGSLAYDSNVLRGGGLKFTGNDGIVNLSRDGDYFGFLHDPTEARTVTLLMRADDPWSDKPQTIFAERNHYGGLSLRLLKGKLEAWVAKDLNTRDMVSMDYSDSNWHQITLVYDAKRSGRLAIYRDGSDDYVEKNTNMGILPQFQAESYLGNGGGVTNDAWPAGFKGMMDDVRIYERGLTNEDIGQINLRGDFSGNRSLSSSVNSGNAYEYQGIYYIDGSGNDIWNTSDEGHGLWRWLSGDFTITAKLTSLSNTNEWTKTGIVIRENDDANAKYAGVLATPTSSHGVVMQTRTTKGGNTNSHASVNISLPVWLRLTRIGNSYKGEYSTNGTTWTLLSEQTVASENWVRAGLVTCSHDVTKTAKAKFKYVTVTPPVETWRQFQAAHSNKMLDVKNGGANGTQVWQFSDNNTNPQQWLLRADGKGTFRIIPRHADLALAASGAGVINGTKIIAANYNADDHQSWWFDHVQEGWLLRARHTGKVLSISGSSLNDGAEAIIWDLSKVSNQSWKNVAP